MAYTMGRFRRNHSSRVGEIRPGHCKSYLQQMGYSNVEIATVLARSMRTMNRFSHSCVRFTMGVHPCLQTLAYIMGRLRVGHSCRMDASTTHRLS